jgi:hypothetical protein
VNNSENNPMTDLNAIVTCHNRETYWPYLRSILSSYTLINPHIAYVYNGSDPSHLCDIRIPNSGHALGWTESVIAGYHHLSTLNPTVNNWLVLCVDSWPLSDSILLQILSSMTASSADYAGAIWLGPDYLAVDIFLCTSRFLHRFSLDAIPIIQSSDLSKECAPEKAARLVCQSLSSPPYLIPERSPVTNDHPTRFSVPTLHWTMSHNLQTNIDALNQYRAQHQQ